MNEKLRELADRLKASPNPDGATLLAQALLEIVEDLRGQPLYGSIETWPSVAWFARHMRWALDYHKARGKRGWREDSPSDLVPRVWQEAMELRDLARDVKLGTTACDLDAMIEHDHRPPRTIRAAIVSECADVANMAMMVADLVAGDQDEDEAPESRPDPVTEQAVRTIEETARRADSERELKSALADVAALQVQVQDRSADLQGSVEDLARGQAILDARDKQLECRDRDLDHTRLQLLEQNETLARMRDRIGKLREALHDCVELLAIVEQPFFEDSQHGARVRQLGEEIGFGALLASASASWREKDPASAHTIGHCAHVIAQCLAKARTTLEVTAVLVQPPPAAEPWPEGKPEPGETFGLVQPDMRSLWRQVTVLHQALHWYAAPHRLEDYLADNGERAAEALRKATEIARPPPAGAGEHQAVLDAIGLPREGDGQEHGDIMREIERS